MRFLIVIYIGIVSVALAACEADLQSSQSGDSLQSDSTTLFTLEEASMPDLGEDADEIVTGLNAYGEYVEIPKSSLCPGPGVDLPEDAVIIGDLSGDTLHVATMQKGESGTLQCNCTQGEAGKCVPIFAAGQANCIIQEGCQACERIWTAKGANKSDAAGGILLKEAKAIQGAADLLNELVEAQGTCSGKQVGDKVFMAQTEEIIAKLNGVDGASAIWQSKGDLPPGFSWVSVTIAGRATAIPVGDDVVMAAKAASGLNSPSGCSCPSGDGSCKLKSSYMGKVYHCENTSCSQSCMMHFGKSTQGVVAELAPSKN